MGNDGKGALIVFDGIDCAGKTSSIATISQWLPSQISAPVRTCRDPGSDPQAESLRELIKAKGNRFSPTALSLLFCAARVQLIENVILPELAAGAWVLCDRYSDSTYAYQLAQFSAADWLYDTVEASTAGIQPDLTIILDVDPAIAISRSQNPDRFERFSRLRLQDIRQAYQKRATSRGDVIIDASMSNNKVIKKIQDLILHKMILK